MPIGIIGGSGLQELIKGAQESVETPYGPATVIRGKLSGRDAAFIPRHGLRHEIPPHRINYKANIYALKKLGCRNVLTTSAAGVISKFKPGDLVLARDFIALHILQTFSDSFIQGEKHTDFTEPFSQELCDALTKAAKKEKISLKDGGVIFTTLGPRYETKAEIRAIARLGANLVNMTNAYETILAGELGLSIATVAIGTNWACGIAKKQLSHEEVLGVMRKKEADFKRLFSRAVGLIAE